MKRHWLAAVGLISLTLVPCATPQNPPATASPDAFRVVVAKKTVTRTFSIADLIRSAGGAAHSKTDGKTLRDLICDTVQPQTWEKAGGAGSIHYLPNERALVVSQTEDVQEEIFELLLALRRLHESQIALEFQVVSVPDATWEKVVHLDWIVADNRVAFLSSTETKQLLDSLRKDKRTETLHRPTLLMQNGQNATIAATEDRYYVTGISPQKRGDQLFVVPQIERKELGFKADISAVISADRRYVQVNMNAKRAQVEDANTPSIPVQIPIPQLFDAPNGQGFIPAKSTIVQMFIQQPKFSTQNVQQKVNMPDGGTCVTVAGKEQRIVRAAMTSPVSPDGQRANNASEVRESHTILFLVTPRILIQEEIEAEILGNQPPQQNARRENQLAEENVYYTAGLTASKKHQLPRDRELRVTQAVAGIGGPERDGKMVSTGPNDPVPGQVLIVRKSERGQPTQFVVHLNRALIDPAEDAVVRAGDYLILQESPGDTLMRAARLLDRGLQIGIRPASTPPMRDQSEQAEPPR